MRAHVVAVEGVGGHGDGDLQRVRHASQKMTTRACASRAPTGVRGARWRRFGRARRADSSRRASARGASPGDEGAAWWAALPAVYVLAFELAEAGEAIYTVSSRTADRATNAFLAFASRDDAEGAAQAVAATTELVPYVEEVAPAVLQYLCRQSGYGAEVVQQGEQWVPPTTTIDLTALEGKGSEPADAVSSATLAAFLAEGADAQDGEDDMLLEVEKDQGAVDEARRAAAAVMREALLMPYKRVRKATGDAAGLPSGTGRDAETLPDGTAVDAAAQLPSSAAAVYAAVMRLTQQRLEALLPGDSVDEEDGELPA